MLSVVKIDYVKCQKPALNADIKTSSSMDSFSRNRDINDINAKAVTISMPTARHSYHHHQLRAW